MRLVTWNVNSIRPRLARFWPWLEERRPDVVCLQETKVSDHVFDIEVGPGLEERGYAWAHHGFGQWNGVAILSRVGLDDVVRGLPAEPGYGPLTTEGTSPLEARAVTATCAGIRVTSVYVPNGRTPHSDHYPYKLAWLAALRTHVPAPGLERIITGDMNIAPTDLDLFDPAVFGDSPHTTPDVRAALAAIQAEGLTDLVRQHWPTQPAYSYWDYRAGMFHKDLGMRIDLVLGSAGLAGRVKAAFTDRAARKGTGTSDHAPVVVDLDEAPDGDIGPVVPPPSNPERRARPAR